jgi:hypothetical protein
LSELDTMVRSDVLERRIGTQKGGKAGEAPANGGPNGHHDAPMTVAASPNGDHAPQPSNGHNGKPAESEAQPQEMGLYGMTPTGLSRRLGRRS